MTVYEWMFYGQLKYRKLLFRENLADVAVVEAALAFVNIENLARLRLSKLTVGQRQCVSIAMALTHKPTVLLIEEPILGLDIYEQLEVMTLLKRLKKELGLTILITMQDLNQAARFSDRLLALKQGNIIADGNVKEVFTLEILRQLYDIDDKTMKLPHDAMNQCLYLPADIGQPA
jgi:iron complex transport system ATP-binding protein